MYFVCVYFVFSTQYDNVSRETERFLFHVEHFFMLSAETYCNFKGMCYNKKSLQNITMYAQNILSVRVT